MLKYLYLMFSLGSLLVLLFEGPRGAWLSTTPSRPGPPTSARGAPGHGPGMGPAWFGGIGGGGGYHGGK